MDKKKVIIIGGGISGMTTGIYLQINGYDTEIVEKNADYAALARAGNARAVISTGASTG